MKKQKQSETLLKDNIPDLIEIYFDIILGQEKLTEDWSSVDKDRAIKAFELIANKLPIYAPEIRATTTADIIKLLRRGKITISETKELMAIAQTDFEITELPKLLEKFERLSK